MNNYRKDQNRSKKTIVLLGIGAFLVLAIAAYWLPPIHSKLSWRVENLITKIKFTINPPKQEVFLPSPIIQSSTKTTIFPIGSQTPTPSQTPTLPGPSPTPEPTFTPIPSSVNLPNVEYVTQKGRWNYCGPANLAMALKYWGWKGSRDDIAAVVKPGIQDMSMDFIQRGLSDKNVMPYELVDYVQYFTDYNVVLRYGGDIDLLKRMVAAGFPVVVEKGYYEPDYTGNVGWMGHYQFVTGYENEVQSVIVQDTYNDGPNFRIKYNKFTTGWRSFGYIFFIVYPPAREAEVMRLLGTWADPAWGYQHALDLANQDIQTQTGVELFFAWFSKGTSLVNMGNYSDASLAYDKAFIIYDGFGVDWNKNPWRMMWYQTGPYKAYYFSGRYGDVINLANITMSNYEMMSGNKTSSFEESFYWRGMAEYALGQTAEGIADLKEAVRLNMNFTPGVEMLKSWGVTP